MFELLVLKSILLGQLGKSEYTLYMDLDNMMSLSNFFNVMLVLRLDGRISQFSGDRL